MSMILSVFLMSMTAAEAPTLEAEVAEKDKVICKRFAPPAGTRLRPRKVCATKQEWAQRKLDRDTEMDNLQNRTSLQSN